MKRLIALLLCCSISFNASAAGIISFIFDDAFRCHNGTVAPFFESRGVRAGFAIPANKVQTDWTLGMTYPQMLALQDKGHEFLAHGYNHVPMTDTTTTLATLMQETVGGLQRLRAEGLKVSAFVAPNSAVHSSLIMPIRSFYRYGFTVYNPGAASAVQQMPLDPHRMYRTSLHAVGLAGAMQAIDAAIASDGLVVFYDHDPLQTVYPNSMPYAQLQQVVDYALAQGAEILPPSQAIRAAELRYVNRYQLPASATLKKK
jgi:peptidoglycan/xylan/chitin deacetylase (PgdA/CDA1 family)